MEIKIQIISTETIKPSSPTPKSLQKHQLSFLDQLAPPIFMPLIYFYPPDSKFSISEKSHILKKSLSRTLSGFYPLAGRLVNEFYVDCADQGSPFFEAEADCDLSDVITNPTPSSMKNFIPYELDDVRNLGVAVQLTGFRCGGAAVGLVISHKIADAFSFFLFANTWAAVARNGDDHAGGGWVVLRPKFDMAAIFPPRDVAGYRTGVGIVKEEVIAKIFTFPASKIAALRDRYSRSDEGGAIEFRPTRVEALSTFIWTRFVSSTKMKPDPNKIYTVFHAVNLRTRLDPPLSNHHFGNISRIATAKPAVGDNGLIEGGYELLLKVREAIKAVDRDYVAQLKEGDKHLNFLKEKVAQADKAKLESFSFTSLCRFPLYEEDFGWGKPVWVGSAGLTYKNLVTFMDSPTGDGIDAWIHLKKEDMKKFEADLELQEFILRVKSNSNKNFSDICDSEIIT